MRWASWRVVCGLLELSRIELSSCRSDPSNAPHTFTEHDAVCTCDTPLLAMPLCTAKQSSVRAGLPPPPPTLSLSFSPPPPDPRTYTSQRHAKPGATACILSLSPPNPLTPDTLPHPEYHTLSLITSSLLLPAHPALPPMLTLPSNPQRQLVTALVMVWSRVGHELVSRASSHPRRRSPVVEAAPGSVAFL